MTTSHGQALKEETTEVAETQRFLHKLPFVGMAQALGKKWPSEINRIGGRPVFLGRHFSQCNQFHCILHMYNYCIYQIDLSNASIYPSIYWFPQLTVPGDSFLKIWSRGSGAGMLYTAPRVRVSTAARAALGSLGRLRCRELQQCQPQK